MKYVTISKTQATELRRPANAWRSDLYKGASWELCSRIAAVHEAETAYRLTREEGRRLRELVPAGGAPSMEEIQNASAAVEAPDILRAPVEGRQVQSILWSDGTTTSCDPQSHRTLSEEEIETLYAGDTDRLAEARKAFRSWARRKSAAVRKLLASSHSPAHLEAKQVADRQFEQEIRPAHDAWVLAKRQLREFEAKTPEDRLAHVVALFEIEGGRFAKSGGAKEAESAFSDDGEHEGDKLATLMFRYLAAAIDDPACVILSGQEAVRMQWDQARAAALHAAE